jgi:hypothetical protein
MESFKFPFQAVVMDKKVLMPYTETTAQIIDFTDIKNSMLLIDEVYDMVVMLYRSIDTLSKQKNDYYNPQKEQKALLGRYKEEKEKFIPLTDSALDRITAHETRYRDLLENSVVEDAEYLKNASMSCKRKKSLISLHSLQPLL